MGDRMKTGAGKPRYSLLPWDALAHVVAVLEYGAGRYGDRGWQSHPDGEATYIDATLRHLSAHLRGERTDPDTGAPHLAHAAADILIALWHATVADGE